MPIQRSRDVPDEFMPPKEDRVEGIIKKTEYRKDLPISRTNRPRTRNDVFERIMRYPEWENQVLSYMSQFKTWDELYEDMERRESNMRDVTPAKPKRIADGNSGNSKSD